jgi:hypothetical protein
MGRRSWAAFVLIQAGVIAAAAVSAAPATFQEFDRRTVIAALETLMATGEPRHIDHDTGQWLQLAVDDAIARGDREIERLAIRAASPLTAAVSRPVSSTDELPSLGFQSWNVLRVKNAIPYTAQVYASVDSGEFVRVAAVRSGKSEGQRVDRALPAAAAMPGFHVVRSKAVLTFTGTGQSGSGSSWTESRILEPVVYGVYDRLAEFSAPMRALVFGPASTPMRQFDPLLTDEPFATWLSELLSTRRTDKDTAPEWLSQYCDERTSEAGAKSAARAICSVVYFQSRGEIGQIWFRTAELGQAERGPEWVLLSPPRFDGMVIRGSAQQSRQLSALPSLLDAGSPSRPVGDVAISPADIGVSPLIAQAGAIVDVRVTVRNAGDGDLHKTLVYITFATDLTSRGTTREFVVDIPAHEAIELKLQAGFPAGYGVVMAHALQLTEHSPHDNPVPDPTPENACAFRIVNARLAPPKYVESVFAAAAGCSGQ